jgi:hypothetical protein
MGAVKYYEEPLGSRGRYIDLLSMQLACRETEPTDNGCANMYIVDMIADELMN